MSGIAGFVARSAQGSDASRIVEALAHRGDARPAVWCDDAALMVQATTRTTIGGAAEPVVHAATGAVIVADVRLDNRDELSLALGVPPDAPDAHLILESWIRWGASSVNRLRGDFAFAIWDGRTRTLFAARDIFGVKPLVFCALDGFFTFASEVSVLLAIDEVPREIDGDRVNDFLAIRFTDETSTFYEHIERVPPASTLTWSDGRIVTSRYWDPRDARDVRLGSNREYAAAFGESFRRAVTSRMVAPAGVGVGAMLSGGLDSSSIACTARNASGGGALPVYSWAFSDALEADEHEYQAAVERSGGFARTVLDSATTPFTLWEGLDRLIANGPPYAPNFYLNYGAGSVARERGVRVLLDGTGGDGAVSHGYARLVELFVGGHEWALARELRALSAREGRGVAPLFWSHVVGRLVSPRWLDRVRGRASKDAVPWLRRQPVAAAAFTPVLRARDEHEVQLRSPLLAEGLELFDRIGVATGAEPRYPFFDRDLVELCVGLPAAQKLSDGLGRFVLRAAMEGTVPDQVRLRSGKGRPGLHIIRALRASRPQLDRLLVRDAAVLEPWVDVAVLHREYARFMDAAEPPFRRAVELWATAALVMWLQNRL